MQSLVRTTHCKLVTCPTRNNGTAQQVVVLARKSHTGASQHVKFS